MKKVLALCVGLCLILGSVSSAKAASYSDAVIADNPFAYYRLDEGSVLETVMDEMGNHHGIFQNEPTVGIPGAIQSDPAATAVSFDRSRTQYAALTTFGDLSQLGKWHYAPANPRRARGSTDPRVGEDHRNAAQPDLPGTPTRAGEEPRWLLLKTDLS